MKNLLASSLPLSVTTPPRVQAGSRLGVGLTNILPHSANPQPQLPWCVKERSIIDIEPTMELLELSFPEFEFEACEKLPVTTRILTPKTLISVRIADSVEQLCGYLEMRRMQRLGYEYDRVPYTPTPIYSRLVDSLDIVSDLTWDNGDVLVALSIYEIDALLAAGVYFPNLPDGFFHVFVLPGMFYEKNSAQHKHMIFTVDKRPGGDHIIKKQLVWTYDILTLSSDVQAHALCLDTECFWFDDEEESSS